MAEQLDGLVLLDKPAGLSSFAAIARLRPLVGRKVGHAGTLDPFATGLLLVFCGRATRLARFLAGADKSYVASVRFGAVSTTGDPEGEITETGATTRVEDVAAALAAFRGEIEQVPPAASAVHIDGERAYKRFRRGEDVVMPTRTVNVHSLELEAFDPESQEAVLSIRCSTGTYVRSIARDLGEALGCGAYLTALRRTRIGPFAVDAAVGPEEAAAQGLRAPAWREPLDAAPMLPLRALDAAEADDFRHGRRIAGAGEEGPVRCAADGRLVAIGVPGDDGRLRPEIALEGV